MNILLFGGTGMVGQAVLRECLTAPDVGRVVAVGRSPAAVDPGARPAPGDPAPGTGPRLTDLVLPDLNDLSTVKTQLSGFDACFFCLGVSSVGMNEADYTRITYDLTLSIARTLLPLNPAMTFVYVTGASTDSSERGSSMWARVKGRTENALLGLGFRAAYMFRPGVIRPMHAVRSKTALYRITYVLATPLMNLIGLFWPDKLVTSVQIGQAMLSVARIGYIRPILEVPDIKAAAQGRRE